MLERSQQKGPLAKRMALQHRLNEAAPAAGVASWMWCVASTTKGYFFGHPHNMMTRTEHAQQDGNCTAVVPLKSRYAPANNTGTITATGTIAATCTTATTGTIATTGTTPHTATLVNPICATQFHRHYVSWQPALYPTRTT